MREKFNAHLCFSPMIPAQVIVDDKSKDFSAAHCFQTCQEDRPLIVQICGNDKHVLLQAAQKFVGYCDGIDLNLGCPQNIARKGYYGAFLGKNVNLVEEILKHLRENIPQSILVSAKIRIFDDLQKTLSYAKAIEGTGINFLTVHGRTLEDKKSMNFAKWDFIKKIV